MSNKKLTYTLAAGLTTLLATPLVAQVDARAADPLTASIQDGATHLRHVFTAAAEQMSEEDFAFKPTPEVRSFGQLLAHVADTSFAFCAAASGVEPPVADVESTRTTKAAIQQALLEAFEYCDEAFASMNDEANAKALKPFMGKPRPALALLNFRNYHSLLHWGNAITYMRLRGKVPPST